MRIAYAFFCEDLRTERTGQISAVGLWGAQCNVPVMPANLRAFAFHAFVAHGGEDAAFTISISFPGAPPLPDVNGRMVSDPGTIGQNFNVVLGPVQILEPGEVRVRFQIHGREPVDETFTLHVALNQRPTDPPVVQH